MSLKNIKNSQGFTIVELLIVVVVIAILAAITIVSYNGITTRANASAAKSAAANVQKKAELYFAENSTYPAATVYSASGAAGKPYELPATSFAADAADLEENGKSKVLYTVCGGGTGAQITYWDYESTAEDKATNLKIGTGTC